MMKDNNKHEHIAEIKRFRLKSEKHNLNSEELMPACTYKNRNSESPKMLYEDRLLYRNASVSPQRWNQKREMQ
jgi:hypothetical protein